MKALKAIGKGELNAVEDSATEQHNTGREGGGNERGWKEGKKGKRKIRIKAGFHYAEYLGQPQWREVYS